MPLLTKVGSFTTRTTTGTLAITGLGFAPKALIVWGGSTGASGAWAAPALGLLGFSSGPTNSFAVGTHSQDAVATSNTSRRMAAAIITLASSDATGVICEASVASFDADGFTLNFTTASPAINLNFLAIGGSDLTGAKVINWTTPTAAGNKAVTGVGFSPDLVLHASAFGSTVLPASSAVATFTFGVMNRHGQQWGNAFHSADAVSPSDTARYQQTDACLMLSNPAASGVFYQAHFASVDADGFTTHFSSTTATAEPVISLCLKGVSSKVGAFAKTTAAAPAAQSVTRVGFQPKAVLTSNTARVASGTPNPAAYWSLGATDGVAQRAAMLGDDDGVNPTKAHSLFASDAVVARGVHVGGTPTFTDKGALASMDADGFSLSFDPNQAYADEVLYLALGDAGVSTYPTRVG